MARINLLPWREEARRERQRQFMYSLLGTLVLGAILVLIIGMFYDQRINIQETRNGKLQSEINRLQQRINRINELERTRDRLLSRKAIIEELQASRSLTVEMLDKLAKSIPVGVTLGNVRQQGNNVTLLGTAQSNARVSAYLQSLQDDDLFTGPDLQYVRASQNPESRVEPYEFSIRVRLNPRRDQAPDDSTDQVAGVN